MAAKGGDSKQVLTISLVLFVLLSVLLGIMAFLGYSDQADTEKKLRDAEVAKKDFEKLYNRERFLKAVYKILAGHADQDKDDRINDFKTLAGLKREHEKEFADEIAKIQERNKAVQWNPADDKPTGNDYITRIENLKNDAEKEKKKAAELQKQVLELNIAVQQRDQKIQDQLTEFGERTKKLNEELAANPKKNAADQDKLAKQVEELTKKNTDLQEQLVKLQDERNRTVAKLDKELESYKGAIKQAQQRIAKVDMLSHDQPKAKVVSVDRSGQVVYLDLGSLDHVKPQLTFSVFGAVNGRADSQRKGSVEVVEVIGPHLAKARVTDLRNPYQHGVIPGDLLFNPAWSPSLREHVAIAGKIDLTGDGRDSTPEFIRSLERMNIKVDAYLDLSDGKEGTIKGEGMTHNTTYLVEGINPGSPEIEKMKQRANELGVTTVPARRFMALMGYRLPRGTIQPIDYAPYPTPNQAAGKPIDAPKLGAKEPGKDEMKKDEPEPKKDEPKEEPKKDDKEMKKDDKEMKKDDKEKEKE